MAHSLYSSKCSAHGKASLDPAASPTSFPTRHVVSLGVLALFHSSDGPQQGGAQGAFSNLYLSKINKRQLLGTNGLLFTFLPNISFISVTWLFIQTKLMIAKSIITFKRSSRRKQRRANGQFKRQWKKKDLWGIERRGGQVRKKLQDLISDCLDEVIIFWGHLRKSLCVQMEKSILFSFGTETELKHGELQVGSSVVWKLQPRNTPFVKFVKQKLTEDFALKWFSSVIRFMFLDETLDLD